MIHPAPSLLLALLFPALLAACASPPAQHGHAHGPQAHQAGGHAHAAVTPYRGMQQREIKSLSPQEIADLQAGRGMGLALAAELNGYPGPLHTLELAEPLKLSPEQQARTREVFARMQVEARALGAEVIAAERALDALFKERTVTAEKLAAATDAAARAQGRLRAAHLRHHLQMMEVLAPEQVDAYQRLRGY